MIKGSVQPELLEQLLNEVRAFLGRKKRENNNKRVFEKLVTATQPLLAKDLFAPTQDALGRKVISSLKKELGEFSQRESSSSLSIRIASEEGKGYILEVVFKGVVVSKFWHPYFMDKRPVLIVYTEPTFFRLDELTFVRHLDSNSGTYKDLQKRTRHIQLPTAAEAKPSTHYLSAGEAAAVIQLTRFLERNRIETDTRVASDWSEDGTQGFNLVLFGNRRTFRKLAELSESHSAPFVIRPHHIDDLTGATRKEQKLTDTFMSTGPVKGIVHRFRLKSSGQLVTIFASNHGAFFEGAVRDLTNPKHDYFPWRKVQHGDAIVPPRTFAALGEARIRAEKASGDPCVEWLKAK